MNAMAKLLKHMLEEADDAKTYAKCAMAFQEKDSSLAETFLALAREELNHYSRLSEQMNRYVTSVPANSEDAFDCFRGETADRYAEAKALVDSIR